MEQTIASSKSVECTLYSVVIHVTSLKKKSQTRHVGVWSIT